MRKTALAAERGYAMSEVIRIFVEKKPGFNGEARRTMADLTENLGLKSLEDLRLVNRYDISGLKPEEFAAARGTIFSEPNTDLVYEEQYPLPKGYRTFAVEYLPGQYDQRADSAAQCVQLLTRGERPLVRTAKLYAVKGDFAPGDLEKMEDYLINPVESRLAALEKPETLTVRAKRPPDVAEVDGFISWDDAKLKQYHTSMGFAMSFADLAFCQSYFRSTEHRSPTVTELRVIDTYWSDHCRHTTFLTELRKIGVEKSAVSSAIEASLRAYYRARDEVYGKNTKRPVTLMDMAVIGMKLLKKRGKIPDLDVSEEINACSIEVPVTVDGEKQTWLVQFKNETHNHPTEIEPFGGAATCLGGAIRDPLSGRAYVYQAMRVTGSGDPRVPFEKTLRGKLPSRKITTGAAQGYSSYGNQVGLATGQVTEFYDPGYVAKRMEIGAVIGAVPKENVVRREPRPGDIVVLLGGATGRDGCGGATGSSKAHTAQSIETCGAEVQKGNPPTERKIQRLFRHPGVARMIRRCNDFGAGGISVAVGELADGLSIDLDKVPKKYEGLDGTELAISESQERMAVVLAPEDVKKFLSAAAEENLAATPIAAVTKEPRLRMTWRGKVIVDFSREFLNTNGVRQQADAEISAVSPSDSYREKEPECLRGLPVAEAFRKNLQRLEVCGQRGLCERFDSSIGAGTVLMPFGGKYQLTPEEAMVAKIPVAKGETDDATAMSFGFLPGEFRFSPFHGAAWAVVESLSRLASVGADPLTARLTFQEYFERMTDNPKSWGKPVSALLGALSAQLGMGLPAIGGKDSMSGTFEDLHVPPTLVSFAVAMTKASRTVSAEFKAPGAKVVLIPVPEDSETKMPNWPALRRTYRAVCQMVKCGRIVSASTVKEGGVGAAIARMCFGNRIGFRFLPAAQDGKFLFAPACGAMIAELSGGLPEGTAYIELGETLPQAQIELGGEILPLGSLVEAWDSTLEPIFPTKAAPVSMLEVPSCTERCTAAPAVKAAKPRVFIPVFPGTNCEYDSARAFERAGAEPDVLVVKNLTPAGIEETVERMEMAIRRAQIIMIPGGFSGGDEPDGSGKFIATAFRSPRVSEAVANLLERRDGLMLGICNGFQALIKLGLVPYGHITEPSPDAPTLTFNTLGRHVSRMVYTRIASVKSPWLAGTEPGEVFAVPVSHGEGRFAADSKTLSRLIANGQIATQYCTPDGVPSGKTEWNPNGSVCAVEGITSPDGRILGKMGHSERRGRNICKNVPGEKDQKIFESGVKYFR